MRGFPTTLLVMALLIAAEGRAAAATDDRKGCVTPPMTPGIGASGVGMYPDEGAAMQACTRAISSGKYQGRDLGALYYHRGRYENMRRQYSIAANDLKNL